MGAAAIRFRTGELLRMLRTEPGSRLCTRRLCRTRLPTARAVEPLAGARYRWMERKPGWWGPVGDGGAVAALDGPQLVRCPYGSAGAVLGALEPHHLEPFRYHVVQGPDGPRALPGRPVPAARMPRAMVRVRLAVTAIRLERLGEASTYDAHAELGTPVGRLDAFRNFWRRELGVFDPDAWTWAIAFTWEPLRAGVAPATMERKPGIDRGLWDGLPSTDGSLWEP